VLGTTIRGYGHVIVVKGVNADGKLICNDPYWRPHGAGDDIYSWDDLGNCPFVVIPDRVVANTQPTQPTAPATTGKAFDSINALTGQPETITVNEPFLSYWQKNGGLPILACPLRRRPPQRSLVWALQGVYSILNVLDLSGTMPSKR